MKVQTCKHNEWIQQCDTCNPPREPHIYTETDLKESLEERTKEILEMAMKHIERIGKEYNSPVHELYYEIKTKYGL